MCVSGGWGQEKATGRRAVDNWSHPNPLASPPRGLGEGEGEGCEKGEVGWGFVGSSSVIEAPQDARRTCQGGGVYLTPE